MTTKPKPKRAKGAGTFEFIRGHWHVRVSLPDGTRPRYVLHGRAGCECATMSEERRQDRGEVVSARERARVTAELAAAAPGPELTFRTLGEQWTEGKLHAKWPDHVRAKRSADDDRERLVKHVYPHVQDVPVARFTIEHAERVMAALDPQLSPATRRHVAQLMHRLLALAVWPCRLRESNPLPAGFMPKVRRTKALSYLYPSEDAQLLACPDVPLLDRMFFGFLAREGMRVGEALGLDWRDVDLKLGSVRLDANKSDDPRAWALGPDVRVALERWHALHGSPARGAVFMGLDGRSLRTADHLAARFRAALSTAGVKRPELTERSRSRSPIRVHDLRATFVTLALASGRTETWVADRTGHRSSEMINRYRRTARHAAELGLGWLAEMQATIPELAELANVRSLRGAG